jgi:DNA modification methylase
MTAESFLNGRVTLWCADMRDALARLEENSVDSVCCDPPYHLTSIVKRFGAENAAPAKAGKTGAYKRASAGFMGKQWDGGDVAFQVETWRAVFRVMKPGAHLVAFSGTRTYHRMVCAIEDTGFEVRDQIGWAFGSGFPKSHDISKHIDRTQGGGMARSFDTRPP